MAINKFSSYLSIHHRFLVNVMQLVTYHVESTNYATVLCPNIIMTVCMEFLIYWLLKI